MIDPRGGNRFLLTAAVSRYPRSADLDRPELADDVARVADLLANDFGYTHVPVGTGSPTSAQLRDELRAFCRARERRSDDMVAVYLACHGAILDPSDFVLLPSDIDPADLLPLAVTPQALAGWLLRETKVQRLLLMLDTCYSGLGGREAAQAAVRWVNQPGAADRAGVVLVTATHPWQMAQPGAFSTAFERAVNHLASGGYAQEDLPLDAVAEVMKADRRMPSSQTVTCHYLGLSGRPPPFLPNPRYRPLLIDVDLLEQERASNAEQRTGQLRDRFIPATRWFTGRHTALADITRWLDTPTTSLPVLVVTGNAGSGKTALLGLLAALSDPGYGPTIPRDGLPPGLDTREGVIIETIYAGTMTTSQIRDRIATAADLHAETTGELIEGLRRREGGTLLVLIDALDEAADPPGLITGLLDPLIRDCPGTPRLLLGNRPHLLTTPLLGKPGQGRYQLVDLDSRQYADPPSIRAYIRRILLSSDSLDSAYRPSGLYRAAPLALLDEVIEAIGDAAGTSFLVARITATTEATAPQLPDPADRAWRRALPRHAGEAMRRDLHQRLGPDAGKAARLLLPLAYAQGTGLPWENIWPSLANALSPVRRYGNDELVWLRKAAGSYAVEGLADGRSVYRLFHQALVEHLLQPRDQGADQEIITRTLASIVAPGDRHARDWAAAHSYIRVHLATHAARAGTIDTLLTDPGYLLAASRPQLLAAADTASTPPAQAAADAYRRAAHHLRTTPPSQHASYLQLAARCGRAPQLADALDEYRPPGTWASRWAAWLPTSPHRTLIGHTGTVNAVAVAELDGRAVIVSGSDDRTVRLWDLTTCTPVGNPFTGHKGGVTSVAVAELDGRSVIVSGSDDRTVLVRDLATGTPVGNPFTGHKGDVTSVAVAELDGRPVIVSGSDDRTVLVRDLATGTPVGGRSFTGHSRGVTSVVVAELDGRPVIVSGSDDRTVRLWDLATGTLVRGPLGHKGRSFTGDSRGVNSVAVAQLDGQPVVVSGNNYEGVQVWDLVTGTPVGGPPTDRAHWVRSVAVAQLDDRPVVVSGSHDGVRVWDPATGTTGYGRLIGHKVGGPLVVNKDGVNSVAVAELDGRPVIVSGGDDRTVRVWELVTGTSVGGDPFTGHKGSVTSVAVAELGGRPLVVSGSDDGTVRVWDLVTGTPVGGGPLSGHVGYVQAVAVAQRDGRPMIVSGSSDETLRVWDLATGAPVGGPLTGHAGWVRSVAVAELDGRPVIVSGSDDETVRVWDLATGTPVGGPLTRHKGYVVSVAVAELRGRPVVVSGSDDQTVRVTDLSDRRAVRRHLRLIRLRHPAPLLSMLVMSYAGELRAFTGCADNVSRIWRLPACQIVSRANIPGQFGISAITALTSGHVLYASGSTIYLHKTCDSVEAILAIKLDSEILAMAAYQSTVIVATQLGLVAIEIPSLK